MSPHITELIYELEKEQQLLATVENSHWPEQAKTIPTIGNAFKINNEVLLQLNPRYIFIWNEGTSQKTQAEIEALFTEKKDHTVNQSTELIRLSTHGLYRMHEHWYELATILGAEQKAKSLITRVKTKLAQSKRAKGKAPLQALFVLSAQPLYVVGGKGLLADVMNHCGVENAFKNQEKAALQVNTELVLSKLDNDEIALIFMTEQTANLTSHWRDENKTIILKNENLYRPTPKIVEAVQTMCAKIDAYR